MDYHSSISKLCHRGRHRDGPASIVVHRSQRLATAMAATVPQTWLSAKESAILWIFLDDFRFHAWTSLFARVKVSRKKNGSFSVFTQKRQERNKTRAQRVWDARQRRPKVWRHALDILTRAGALQSACVLTEPRSSRVS